VNTVGRFNVRLTSSQGIRNVPVRDVTVLTPDKQSALDRALSTADVIAVSVGTENLAAVAPMIARALAQRISPVNVLAFENMLTAGTTLRKLVKQHLPADFPLENFGFSGALVVRAVTQRIGDFDGITPVTFLGDTPETFTVHGPSLVGPTLTLSGMISVDNYSAAVMRKLYVFSAGHATTAYLGALKGYHYIHTAIGDPEIRATVIEAMVEGQKGLASHFGSAYTADPREIDDIIRRFENASICDPITRVGRDPLRKLQLTERLIGAARMAADAGVPPTKLGLAAAAALCFYNAADPKCKELQHHLETMGIHVTLCEICGLKAEDTVQQCIAERWNQLASGWRRGNMLLSLTDLQWAWS